MRTGLLFRPHGQENRLQTKLPSRGHRQSAVDAERMALLPGGANHAPAAQPADDDWPPAKFGSVALLDGDGPTRGRVRRASGCWLGLIVSASGKRIPTLGTTGLQHHPKMRGDNMDRRGRTIPAARRRLTRLSLTGPTITSERLDAFQLTLASNLTSPAIRPGGGRFHRPSSILQCAQDGGWVRPTGECGRRQVRRRNQCLRC